MPWRIVLLLSVLLLNSACESKPINARVTKATQQEPQPNSIALVIKIEKSPRSDLEQKLLLERNVQACLRKAAETRPFSVTMEGQVISAGKILKPSAEHPTDSVRSCLLAALGQISLGSGASGPFKIRISGVSGDGTQPKTFLLDLSELKKFQ